MELKSIMTPRYYSRIINYSKKTIGFLTIGSFTPFSCCKEMVRINWFRLYQALARVHNTLNYIVTEKELLTELSTAPTKYSQTTLAQ